MMTVLNPFYLAGLAAAGVPIIIHLLTRDRVRKVAFSSLRFFANASRHVLRRKRFSEALVIALRMLICAVLALVFARPVWRGRDTERAAGRVRSAQAVVVAVDVSASMQRLTDSVGLQETVRGIIRDVGQGDSAVGLVVFDDTARVLQAPSRDRTAVERAVHTVEIGCGATDIVAGLQEADRLLAEVVADGRDIILVSDLQRNGARRLTENWHLSPGVRLSLQPPGKRDLSGQVGIIAADWPERLADDRIPRAVSVRVACFGDADVERVPVVFSMGGRDIAREHVRIPAGESVAVRFRHTFSSPGDNLGTIRLDLADGSPFDNVAHVNVRVIPRVPVLLVQGGRTGRSGAPPFVHLALAPDVSSPFEVRAVPSGNVSPADLEWASVVVLDDVSGLTGPALVALRAVPERGGGILALPGSSVTSSAFNAAFADLLPCRLRAVSERSTGPRAPLETGLTDVDYTHPVFEVFLRPHHGDFSALRFSRYWEITGSQLSRVLARYENGRPAILERDVGTGVSVIWLSPVDVAWNNLPLRAIFLPLLHQTVRHLALRTEESPAHTVGDLLPVPEGMRLRTPDGTLVASRAVDAAAAGFYALETAAGEVFHYAVNPDWAEAVPTAITAEEVAAAMRARGDGGAGTEPEAAVLGPVTDRGAWRVLLAALLVLSMVELVIANRAVRH